MAPQHAGLKTYKASEMSVKDLQEATARPRIDFASILSTVRARSAPNHVEAAAPIDMRRTQKVDQKPQFTSHTSCTSRPSSTACVSGAK